MLGKNILHNILTVIMLILLIAMSHVETSNNSKKYARFDLRNIDSHGNVSKFIVVQRMAARSHQRMIHLVKRTQKDISQFDSNLMAISGAQTDVHLGISQFVMDMAIGTPSLPFPAVLDTGSDLIWTQCKPCEHCFNQSTPIFDPSKSSTYKMLPCTADMCKALISFKCGVNNSSCHYRYAYADKTSSSGKLSSETFTLGSTKFDNIAFGCGNNNTDGYHAVSGLAGLGRGPLSLISQLGFKKFSHCFVSLDKVKKSPMFFGSLAYLNESAATGPTQSMRLVQNPKLPSLYYVPLLGLTVGTTKLNIPSSTFALKSDGRGGTIIDSGATLTYLQTAIYNVVKTAFISQIKFPAVNGTDTWADLCFSVPSNASLDVPKFILHFDGVDLDLPDGNYFIINDAGLLCLTVLPSPGVASILGNYLQQDFFIVYDIGENKLSFTPTQCDKL